MKNIVRIIFDGKEKIQGSLGNKDKLKEIEKTKGIIKERIKSVTN